MPQARRRLRIMLDLDAVQRLPERFDRLTETVEALAAAQQRTEERVAALAEAQQRTEQRLERLEATVQALAEAQQRTEQRLEQLVEAQQRTEQRMDRLEATMQALAEAQRLTEKSLRQLSVKMDEFAGWRRGEAGRREGERYESLIQRRAPSLFNGGHGGSPGQYPIYQQLQDLLQSVMTTEPPAEKADPFLADLIWWKGEQVAAVEVSRRVNGNDVMRAARRAETLRKANLPAIGIVIGQEWVGPSSRQAAESHSVEWKIGDDLSEGFLAFRAIRRTPPP